MKLAVVGLGYVGLPLAIELGKHFATVGYDLKSDLIAHYRNSHDPTGEVGSKSFDSSHNLCFTDNPRDIMGCEIYIVAVPTPVDEAKQPDLLPLKSASETVASVINKGCMVLYESTVFPGATEDIWYMLHQVLFMGLIPSFRFRNLITSIIPFLYMLQVKKQTS